MRLAVCTVFWVVLPVSAQERPVGQGVNFYSAEKEAALGARLSDEVRQKTTAIDSATLIDYVEKIGRQLAGPLPNQRFPYTFAVVADDLGGPTHEPASLPGGYVFVPAQLILAAQNEAAFAGMLAHAMAHIAERHGTRQATRSQLMNGSSASLVFLGGWMNLSGGGQAIPIGLLSFQRRFEIDADGLAAKLASGAGFDPEALVSYIRRVQPDDGDGADAFSPMPARRVRIASLEKAIQGLGQRVYVASGEEFGGIQEEVRRVLRR